MLLIDASMPNIEILGSVIFDSLDVHSELYVPLAGIVQEKAKIEGKVIFSTRYINNPITMFSNFTSEGRIKKISNTIPNRNIPWKKTFLSPFNYILIFSIILGVIIDANHKLRYIVG